MDLPQNLLSESELDDKLSAQIQQTLQTENELASLVKQRDESKQKSDQIQQLTSGNKFALTETIKKLVEATARLDADIKAVKQHIHTSNEADPQQSARDLSLRLDELRFHQNAALQLERRAKEVVFDHLSGISSSSRRQLKVVSSEEIAKDRDLSKILDELNERKKLGKRWAGIYSIAAMSKPS